MHQRTAALLDPDTLRYGDLDVIDMIPVPQRFEHAVGEAEHQDVLNRLLSEIMVDDGICDSGMPWTLAPELSEPFDLIESVTDGSPRRSYLASPPSRR